MSDHSEIAEFHLPPASEMNNSLISAWEGASPLTVHASTFDAWAAGANPGKLPLIKIDVEGAEPLVLRGMRMTLASPHKPQVIIEFCPKNLLGREAEWEIYQILSINCHEVQCINSCAGLRCVKSPSYVCATLKRDG